MKITAKTLAGVHTHTHTGKFTKQNTIKLTRANTVSSINNIKNKELYVEKSMYSSFLRIKNRRKNKMQTL